MRSHVQREREGRERGGLCTVRFQSSEGAKGGAGGGGGWLYCEVQCIMGYGELKTLPSRTFVAYLLCQVIMWCLDSGVCVTFESNTKKYSTSIVMLHCTTEQYWANALFGITQHGYMSGCYPITNENRDAALLGTLCCSYSLVITVRLRKNNSSYEYWTNGMSGDIWQCMGK